MKQFLRYQADLLRTRWKIGREVIELPRGHVLAALQRRHRLYDRFLPFLAAGRAKHEWIIDVGANVGDTAASLVQVCDSTILCVEASASFYKFLQANCRRLGTTYPGRIKREYAFAGTGTLTGVLVEREGSAHIAPTSIQNDDSAAAWLTLDAIVNKHGVAGENIFLIKSDVDGFDYDVMLSAPQILCNANALLYWENQLSTREQLSGYVRYFELLDRAGYKHFWLFDNFGRLMIADAALSVVRSFCEYLYTQNADEVRSIHYVDVLGAKPLMRDTAKQRVEKYVDFARGALASSHD